MSIISVIGRKSRRVRAFIGLIYLLLGFGALTMIYPFALMLSGTTKSSVDTPSTALIPEFMTDPVWLYRKTVEGIFNEDQMLMQTSYNRHDATFRNLVPPSNQRKRLTDEWELFLNASNLPFYYYDLAFICCPNSRNSLPLKLREFKAQLRQENGDDLEMLNRKYHTDFVSWSNINIRPPCYVMRRNRPGDDPYLQHYRDFKEKQPQELRYYFSPEGFFRMVYLKAQYGRSVAEYNRRHQTNYKNWQEIEFPRQYPVGPAFTERQRLDWLDYVRSILNLFWIRADQAAAAPYREFLSVKYGQDIGMLNRLYGTSYKTFSEVPLVNNPPFEGVCLSDWDCFIQGWRDPKTGKMYLMPAEMLRIHSVDFMFRDYLASKYHDLKGVNAALGTGFRKTAEIFPPQQEYHSRYIRKHASSLRWEFVKRNYISVIEYVLLQGRALVNTVVYCLLAVICALIVNPLAAYALSRYRPASAYKVLLFLMITMAFPPVVTQIPIFLMLREFDLLNSFWALVLPGLANGYSIFLLKGFFDSLPRELYECAELDGAGEVRIFFQIAMSMSKPILAVTALSAFTVSYSNFMMALLICQDQRMWTIMPWLYQLQQSSGQGIVFTSLIVAALPTFIIFAFCQNIIMRGIVVPVEK